MEPLAMPCVRVKPVLADRLSKWRVVRVRVRVRVRSGPSPLVAGYEVVGHY